VKHLILGTAGHVDHGKTALIRALTGIECDTHKEEKARGITIHLGFAHLDLPNGDSIGIVDVPGHRDFVRAMVAGASGVDIGLLVVAADSGVMPQTREHLEIMDILGVRNGLVALTKIDLVDEDIAEMAEQEIRDLLSGTFLASAEIVRVSAVTRTGVDDLNARIARMADAVEDRPVGEAFRMFVDRVFTMSGFGTVVTGSVTSGVLNRGDTAYLLPSETGELRVRRLERHGQEVERVVAGDRASINLVGVERKDFERGMIVANRTLEATSLFDARVRLFSHRQRLGLWSRATLHLGAFEDAVRIHLIDSDNLSDGGTALVQIHTSRPFVARRGDRFVIRNSSSDLTLGGGEVIDAQPLHHRRRPAKLVRDLHAIAEGTLCEQVVAEIRKHVRALDHLEVADNLNLPAAEVLKAWDVPDAADVKMFVHDGTGYAMVRTRCDAMKEAVFGNLATFHRRYPLVGKGRTIEELMSIVGVGQSSAAETVLHMLLEELKAEGELKQVGRTWALASHSVAITPEMAEEIRFVEDSLKGYGMQTPLMSEMTPASKRHGIGERELKQYLRYLVSEERARFIDGNYIHVSVVDECRAALVEALKERPEGMTVAGFRDLVGGNRKICLLLLGHYDEQGVTVRHGDLRVLGSRAGS